MRIKNGLSNNIREDEIMNDDSDIRGGKRGIKLTPSKAKCKRKKIKMIQ